jgi:hypothetical protein
MADQEADVEPQVINDCCLVSQQRDTIRQEVYIARQNGY